MQAVSCKATFSRPAARTARVSARPCPQRSGGGSSSDSGALQRLGSQASHTVPGWVPWRPPQPGAHSQLMWCKPTGAWQRPQQIWGAATALAARCLRSPTVAVQLV